MGDIVGSEASPAIGALYRAFNAAIDRQNRERGAHFASPLTITLGDEFQGLAMSLTQAAAAMRDIRIELMLAGIDCRFVIGVATLATPINPDRAWNMMGPGLGRAREKLEEKRGDSRYRFSLPGQHTAEILLDAIGVTQTAIERGWTEQQLLDIAASLSGESAADIARLRNVSKRNVYKVLTAGDFDLYTAQWRAVDAALDDLDRSYGMR